MTSFGIEFQTEDEAKENEPSPCVAVLCAGLLRRGMVFKLEGVLRVCDGFFCSIRMEFASSRPDHLPTLSVAESSKLSLLVKHHILAIDEAS